MAYQIVSVVTPSYNQGNFITETIESILSQAGDFYLDYIVQDGGSTDQTIAIVQSFHKKIESGDAVFFREGVAYYKSSTPRFAQCRGIAFRYSSHPDNGQVSAVNSGLRLAQGDTWAYLNSDDVYYPGAIAKAIKKLRGCDFVYGRGMWISHAGCDLLEYPTFRPTRESLYWQCTLCQPTVFMRRQVAENLGFFDEAFPYVFDYEYWMRAVFAGKNFRRINAWLAKSRMHRGNKSLAGYSTIVDEIRQLKFHYYQRLDSILKIWYQFWHVNRPTMKAVHELESLLQL